MTKRGITPINPPAAAEETAPPAAAPAAAPAANKTVRPGQPASKSVASAELPGIGQVNPTQRRRELQAERQKAFNQMTTAQSYVAEMQAAINRIDGALLMLDELFGPEQDPTLIAAAGANGKGAARHRPKPKA